MKHPPVGGLGVMKCCLTNATIKMQRQVIKSKDPLLKVTYTANSNWLELTKDVLPQ